MIDINLLKTELQKDAYAKLSDAEAATAIPSMVKTPKTARVTYTSLGDAWPIEQVATFVGMIAAKTAAQAGNQMDLVNAPNATAITAIQSGLSTLNAADVRTAVGLASANLDTQLGGISAKTTNLPSVAMLCDADGRLIVDPIKFHWVIVGNTLSAYRADGVTLSYTKTLTTTPGADPITGN